MRYSFPFDVLYYYYFDFDVWGVIPLLSIFFITFGVVFLVLLGVGLGFLPIFEKKEKPFPLGVWASLEGVWLGVFLVMPEN